MRRAQLGSVSVRDGQMKQMRETDKRNRRRVQNNRGWDREYNENDDGTWKWIKGTMVQVWQGRQSEIRRRSQMRD